jgi:uncharacterized membrane protein (UPF0127 family)
MAARTRSRIAAASVIALASALGSGIIVARWISADASAPVPLGLHATRAGPPFPGYPEVEAAIDGTCVRLAVADTPARRARGLLGVDDLRPYAGLLFAQRHDGDAAFTMAGLKYPLDIVWYAAAGYRVDATRMWPCPHADPADCPVYRSGHPYRFALETPAGAFTAGPISACA